MVAKISTLKLREARSKIAATKLTWPTSATQSLKLHYFSPQDPTSFSAQNALGINLGYVAKKTASRIPASFTAVIGKSVVHEEEEALNPFLPPPAPRSLFLPISLNHIRSLQVDQAFHSFPTTSHLH